MTQQKRLNTFMELYQPETPIRTFFAPGRINLIGEHTDYNGGYVFPAAISFGTYALATKRDDRKIKFYSMNFAELGVITVDLDDLSYEEAHDWANYPKGMVKKISKAGHKITHGFNVLYDGNIPNGAGLSSSASIELVTGVMVDSLYDLSIDRIELVKMGQQVENHYIGVNSGIMDQFAIGMAKKDHAILLDTNTLDYQYAPIKLDNYCIMIINTNKRRELVDSKYNERRSECESALKDLQVHLTIDSLGELSVEQFDQYQHLIQSDVERKRAKHAVYENQRTKDALEKLEANDLVAFGQLLNESHLSLQHDYEVTGIELDTLAHTAWKQDGVLGARMTGAGFGGCVIALVDQEKTENFQTTIQKVYEEKIGYSPTFYRATIGDGAKELNF